MYVRLLTQKDVPCKDDTLNKKADCKTALNMTAFK